MDLYDRIEKSREDAKRIRVNELSRFHIGDVAYPLYQSWEPIVWGIIVDIGVDTHKITLNLNGIERQYDPEELVLTNPETKATNNRNIDNEIIQDTIKRRVSRLFASNRAARLASRIYRPKA